MAQLCQSNYKTFRLSHNAAFYDLMKCYVGADALNVRAGRYFLKSHNSMTELLQIRSLSEKSINLFFVELTLIYIDYAKLLSARWAELTGTVDEYDF